MSCQAQEEASAYPLDSDAVRRDDGAGCGRRTWQWTSRVKLPPALLIQDTADKGVPQGMVEKVNELYRAAGGDVELALFQDMPHGLAGWSETEAARMIERVKAFIAKQVTTAAA